MEDARDLNRLRNLVLYQGLKNSLVEWTLSPQWTQPPDHVHVRGECVERWLSSKTRARICRIVANGAVSGEIKNAR